MKKKKVILKLNKKVISNLTKSEITGGNSNPADCYKSHPAYCPTVGGCSQHPACPSINLPVCG